MSTTTTEFLTNADQARAALEHAKTEIPESDRPNIKRAVPTQHALRFEVEARWGRARVGRLALTHFDRCETPMFMPVGTGGTVKGLTCEQLIELDCHVILNNTYHLGHRPGGDVVETMGGSHEFMQWPRGMLTDSGGFQMVSLLKLAEITEEGVTFESPHDGSRMCLTPEHSMHIQNQIGADILMALDDVVHVSTTGPRVEEAMHRTLRWIDRCIDAHERTDEQNLFAIVQGGLQADLRTKCLAAMLLRDPYLPGYAIGGLSGGESKDQFWRVVAQSAACLPDDKPRYLMGVGYAVDLVVCSALGVDMYDCVYPTRTARFGTAMVRSGLLNLRNAEFASDVGPIERECECFTCKNYTRAYLHQFAGRDQTVGQLISLHNIAHQMRLMRDIRQSIREQRFDVWVREFMRGHYPDCQYPQWTVDALRAAGIELDHGGTSEI